MGTFPKNFNGLFLRLMLRICVRNLKFVALGLPVAEIIGVPQKIVQSLYFTLLPLLQNFIGILFGWIDPVNVLAKFEIRIVYPFLI